MSRRRTALHLLVKNVKIVGVGDNFLNPGGVSHT